MSVKVVIVGAGVVGLHCGLTLAERGADVTIIDGDAEDWQARGCAASRAAAGMLAPVSEAQIAHEPSHPRAHELDRASFALWRNAPACLRAHLRFPGVLLLDELGADAEGELLTRAEIERRYGVRAASDGVFAPDEGVVDPIPALHAMTTRIRSLGGAVHFDREAEAIETRPWLRVRCYGGATFTADRIVLAAGAWAGDELKDQVSVLRFIAPAKGVLVPVSLAHDLPLTVRGRDFYLAQRAPGDVVLGSTMEFGVMDRRADPRAVDALFAAAARVVPGQIKPSERPAWAGVRAMSPDWSPLIGPSGPDGVLVAGGHSRNGWLNAPITAEAIAAYVFDDELNDLLLSFHPRRFED